MVDREMLEAILEGTTETATIKVAARVLREFVARYKTTKRDVDKWEVAFHNMHQRWIDERSNREKLEQELARYIDVPQVDHKH